MADGRSKTQRQFDAAVKVIQNLPKDGSFKPSNEMMLKFYCYYKQATLGRCKAAKPGFWDVVGKAKWEAWNSLGDMSSEEAMQGYVSELKKIAEMMPQTEEVGGLVNELDSFYELVDIHTGKPISIGHMNSVASESANGSVAVADIYDSHVTDMSGDSKHMNGHVPAHEHQPNNVLVSSDLAVQHNGYSGTEAKEMPPSAPDVTEANSGSSASRESLHTATLVDSDTDSDELYMDSTDVPLSLHNSMNNSDMQERTVDLLASCPFTPANHSPASSQGQQGVASAHSNLPTHSSTPLHSQRDAQSKVDRRSVSFRLPENNTSPSPSSPEDINEKLRMALLNMQQEISSLEQRLKVVEQITVSQRRHQLSQGSGYMRWWPFPGLQPRTALLVFLWPVMVAWLYRYLRNRRQRS